MPAPSLAALAEPGLADSAILDRFLSFVAARGLTLYPAQEEAILELFEGRHLVLSTPTGSGKSMVALALHFRAFCRGEKSWYTAPIKALVNEKFFSLCEAFGPENVGMATGDAGINRDAPIVCATAEILAQAALRESQARVDEVVMDEFHYYSDPERGWAWQVPLLLLEKTRFLLMSATLGDTTRLEERITAVTGRDVARVHSLSRPVPLDREWRESPLHETIADLVAAGRAPIYLVNFTQRAAAEQAQNLMSTDFCSKEEKEALKQALLGFRFDSPNGKDLSRHLRHGIGIHHAGLLPKYRLLTEKLAQQGLLKVVSGTDTLGMGVNIPLRTVLFTQLCKFDGQKTAVLTARDFHQIAGRAGRKGFDERGWVVAQAPEHVIENKKLAAKEAAGKKVVKQKPPQKGYVHFDAATFERLWATPPEPLTGRFAVTHGMILHLLQSDTRERGGGYGRLVRVIARSHENDHQKAVHRRHARQLFRSLVQAGLVEVVLDETSPSPHPKVSESLQRDFSIHHTLALWLLDTLPMIDPVREEYALDVVTLVESILEDPDVVLWKQLDLLKGEKVAEMKAQGIEYDERMAELEKLEHPKPLRDFVYGTFDAFAAKHPWVGRENVRPKSVAREMIERAASFDEYVREYGLQRSEGVLLRYLSEAYKTLSQSVPERFRDERLEDAIAFLRTVVRGTDSSLIDEWERMRDPQGRVPLPLPSPAPPRPVDPLADRKKFTARVRAELHRLLGVLARRRWEDAVPLLATPWEPKALEQAMAGCLAEHPAIDLTPRARRPEHTFVEELAPRRFRVRQKILGPEEAPDEALWFLECEIDLAPPRVDEGPLLALVRVGT